MMIMMIGLPDPVIPWSVLTLSQVALRPKKCFGGHCTEGGPRRSCSPVFWSEKAVRDITGSRQGQFLKISSSGAEKYIKVMK